MKTFLLITAVIIPAAAVTAASAMYSGEPYKKAEPDSPIVRRLVATPIPENTRQVNYVAAALEMLGQPIAEPLHSYLERSEWLAAMGEPPLRAPSIGEAIALERQAEPIDEVRSRAFATILTVELGKPADFLPEGVRANRANYRQESPVVWDVLTQNADAPVRLLHVAVTNSGKKDLSGIRADVILNTTPRVEVHCEPQTDSALNPVLRAGQRRIMFCATEWHKKVPVKTLVDAAQAVAEGRATLAVRPRWILIHGAAFDLQDGSASSTPNFYRRPFQSSGADVAGRYQAAALVRESSCFDRGTCLAFFLGGMGEAQPLVWTALGAGVVVFAITAAFSRFRVRAKPMWIVTAVSAILPIVVFAALLGSKSMGLGVLIVPVLGSYLWAAFAIGLWGCWLLTLPLRRRAKSSFSAAPRRG